LSERIAIVLDDRRCPDYLDRLIDYASIVHYPIVVVVIVVVVDNDYVG
jgi:hypothetical protein